MRINFFAGPGAGKSTTTARVFSQLKERHFSVEHVGEYVKAWAYQKRVIKQFDQVYLFGKQQQYEYRYLSTGVKNIVTDSPCFLSVVYGDYYGDKNSKVPQAIAAICKEYDAVHPCLNIFLDRGDKPYDQDGRYQSYEAAKNIDSFMLSTLEKHNMPIVKLDYKDQEGILKAVLSAVEK